MAKSSDNIRCIRKYPKKDGTFSFHAEVRRKGAKSLKQVIPPYPVNGYKH